MALLDALTASTTPGAPPCFCFADTTTLVMRPLPDFRLDSNVDALFMHERPNSFRGHEVNFGVLCVRRNRRTRTLFREIKQRCAAY
jgi:hypothetical protein